MSKMDACSFATIKSHFLQMCQFNDLTYYAVVYCSYSNIFIAIRWAMNQLAHRDHDISLHDYKKNSNASGVNIPCMAILALCSDSELSISSRQNTVVP